MGHSSDVHVDTQCVCGFLYNDYLKWTDTTFENKRIIKNSFICSEWLSTTLSYFDLDMIW